MKFLLPSLSLFALLLTLTNSMLADETTPGEDKVPVIEEVIVTGSLLPRGDFVSKAPISTISSTQFEMSNSVNVESLINSMPQVVGGADRSSTFGQGIATANLRGLGENRTLVLVNNRRFVPTFPDGGTVDLNFIPVGLIDRVEILTGGASAAYGSDALAGVINFILREQTDGWEFNGGGEMTEKGDAEIFNFNATKGGNFASGKGSYLVHFDVLERKSVNFIDRDISRVALIDLVDDNGDLSLTNSPNRFPVTTTVGLFNFLGPAVSLLRFDNSGSNLEVFPNIPTPGGGVNGLFQINNGFGFPDGSQELGNINGYANLQVPQERKSLKAKISYEFDSVEVYADAYYSRSDVPLNWGGPFSGFPIANNFRISVENNPFWSDQTKATISNLYQIFNLIVPQTVNYIDDNGNGVADELTLLGFVRSFSEDVGLTENERTFEALQLEVGVKGELNESWGYEIFAQIGEVETVNVGRPLLNPARVEQALLITPEGNCVDPSNGCVPINIWGNNIGPEGAAFITYPDSVGTSVTKNEQNVFTATLSGNTSELFSLPGNPGPIGLVFGAEYLEINADINTASIIEQQQYIGFANFPFSLNGSIDNTSFFGEALIPLISGKPGVDFLELELGWRFSNHSVTGSDTTYKIALSYYPNDQLHFRSSYNKAMRAPAINELFSYSETAGNLPDFCLTDRIFDLTVVTPSGPKIIERDAYFNGICISQGVPEENLYNSELIPTAPDVINRGGNPELLAEEASTFSTGVVWTPYSIEGLSVSVDYFNVEIDNYIGRTPVLVDDLYRICFDPDSDNGGPGSSACNSFNRNSDGALRSIFAGTRNLGFHEVSGWDFNIEYGSEFFAGYLDINYFSTKIVERTIKDDSLDLVDYTCVGLFNSDCDNFVDYPVFDFKHRMTASWSKNNLDLQLVWKYTSSLDDGDDRRVYFTERLSSYSIFDLSGRFMLADKWSFTVGIKNLLDKKPQTIGTNSWEYSDTRNAIPSVSNTYTQYYDVFGRTWFLKAGYNL